MQLAERRAADAVRAKRRYVRRRFGLRVYCLPLDEFALAEKLVSAGLLDADKTDNHSAVTAAAAKFFAAVLELAE